MLLGLQAFCNAHGDPLRAGHAEDAAALQLALDAQMRGFFRFSDFSHRCRPCHPCVYDCLLTALRWTCIAVIGLRKLQREVMSWLRLSHAPQAAAGIGPGGCGGLEVSAGRRHQQGPVLKEQPWPAGAAARR